MTSDTLQKPGLNCQAISPALSLGVFKVRCDVENYKRDVKILQFADRQPRATMGKAEGGKRGGAGRKTDPSLTESSEICHRAVVSLTTQKI